VTAATLTAEKFAEAAEILSLSVVYPGLRRVLETAPPAGAKLGMYVDVETTGLDREEAEVIELGMVPFYFDGDRGQIVHECLLEKVYFSFEEPKGPVSAEITDITGIEPDMLIGQRIDDARVNSVLEQCVLVVAHNAEFDRPILERRLPAFKDKHWACSQREVKWERYGAVGAKLGNILAGVCGEFYEAHRALDDARVGVHVLAHQRSCDGCDGSGLVDRGEYDQTLRDPCPQCVDGTRSPFSDLLQSARLPTIRIHAIGAPFPKKEALKARKYRWNDGERVSPKAWFKDVKTEAERDEELMYLRDIIGLPDPQIQRITSKDRFSARVA
jgi:DNA polymerase-3 subunit epsilon